MGNEFPKRLQMLREREGIKRYILSELCDLEKGTIRRYEREEREPKLSIFIKIAEHFDVSLDYLAGLTDNPKRNL